MSTTQTTIQEKGNEGGMWRGGTLPFGTSYGKMMMWYFLISDTFSFATLLVAYSFYRIKSVDWPIPHNVFVDAPFFSGVELPLVFVSFMTFVLIASSVTMVLAVEAGHRNRNDLVAKYVLLTAIGGIIFLSCQAWEWSHMIFQSGATLTHNPYGDVHFSQLFYVITGFHGLHVFGGVIILLITYFMVKKGIFVKRGHYEFVEKVGLYWHFVDLVWIFVFALLYLI
jgi:cytochrome c oxidase subunit III